jgi:pimeloyl-ACP methyl ester carboxylesterase
MQAKKRSSPAQWRPYRRVPRIYLYGAAAALLGVAAIVNHLLARRAEQQWPARGRFVKVEGIRVHYLERGSGDRSIVLLHGNGATAEDFEVSGLLDLLAQRHRVIAFDRPGFGYSARPRGRAWTAAAQAQLLTQALHTIGVRQPVLVGHSWGALVALAMALEPEEADALVLLAGYFTPAIRPDALLASIAAIPLLGPILRHTVLPAVVRRIAPALLRKIFAPHPVPETFSSGFPIAMAWRPRHLRASAADTALMNASAAALLPRCDALTIPVILMAGTEDKMVNTELHSARLQRRIKGSLLRRLQGQGHMVHHTATEEVAAEIAAVAAKSNGKAGIDAGCGGAAAFPQSD